MWKTSVPGFILKQHIPVKHISKQQRPLNTLDFLKETQRYIAHIRHPELSDLPGKARPRLKTSQLPSLFRPSRSRKLPARNESEEGLIVRARNREHSNEESDTPTGPKKYIITQYMRATPLSPRLVTASPQAPLSPSYQNGDIDRFMHRFERTTRRTKH